MISSAALVAALLLSATPFESASNLYLLEPAAQQRSGGLQIAVRGVGILGGSALGLETDLGLDDQTQLHFRTGLNGHSTEYGFGLRRLVLADNRWLISAGGAVLTGAAGTQLLAQVLAQTEAGGTHFLMSADTGGIWGQTRGGPFARGGLAMAWQVGPVSAIFESAVTASAVGVEGQLSMGASVELVQGLQVYGAIPFKVGNEVNPGLALVVTWNGRGFSTR